MSSQKGGSKMDAVVKLVLIVFVSLLSFSVGTFVGRQFTESELKQAQLDAGDYKTLRETASTKDEATDEDVDSLAQEFVKIEKDKMKEKEGKGHGDAKHDDKAAAGKDKHGEVAAHGAPAAHEPEKTEKQGDYKKLGKGTAYANAKAKPETAKHEQPAKHDEHAAPAKGEHAKAVVAEHAAPTKGDHAAKTEHAVEPKKGAKTDKKFVEEVKAAPGISKAVDRVTEGENPTEAKKEERNPSSVLPAVASSAVGKFTVQVASYASQEEAKAHATQLESKGFSAFFVPATVNNKTWYRVSVGLFTTQDSAMNYRKVLMKQANITSAIVQKIVK